MVSYLVTIEGQRGPEPQIWHKDSERDGFVGCSMQPVTKIALPEREEPWTVAAAMDFALANPDVSKDAR